jgi:hypothetical protein
MKKNLIVLHTSGSCGDLVSLPWIRTGEFYSASSGRTLTATGRMLTVWNPDFVKQFPKQPGKHYYSRNWTQDLDQLSQLSQPWLINTVDSAQAALLKNRFQDQVHVISINYDNHMWPFVLKNFCTKVLDSPNYLTQDDVGEHFLSVVAKTNQERDYYISLGESGLLGHWYAEQTLFGTHINFPPQQFEFLGDTVVRIEEILVPNLIIEKIKNIADILNISVDIKKFNADYNQWIVQQCSIYKYNAVDTNWQQCFGHNQLAVDTADSIPLDRIDQLFIKKYLRNFEADMPKIQFLTLQDFLNYCGKELLLKNNTIG